MVVADEQVCLKHLVEWTIYRHSEREGGGLTSKSDSRTTYTLKGFSVRDAQACDPENLGTRGVDLSNFGNRTRTMSDFRLHDILIWMLFKSISHNGQNS